ncbi:MAG: hypothetical protein MJ250_07405 [Alphaproteobacteria bacterium]|nr:hypothetical protein [Alphaproteobacteria bacterium]
MLYKKSVFVFFVSFFCLILGLSSVVVFRDPEVIFHHSFRKMMSKNMRKADFGLINYENFDSVILGTDSLINASANEASQKIGGTFANLSIPEASFYERFVILNYLLKYKNIKHVILSFEFNHFDQEKNTKDKEAMDLYTGAWLSKWKIYLHKKNLKCVFFNKECDLMPVDINQPAEDYSFQEKRLGFGGFDNWLNNFKNNLFIQNTLKDLLGEAVQNRTSSEKIKRIFDTEIFPVLKNNSLTKFSIIIPPYSALYLVKNKSYFKDNLKAYRYLLERVKLLENVDIYWFFDDKFIFDIANYRDLIHFLPKYNSVQLDAIKNRIHLLTEKNYSKKENDLLKKLDQFDLNYYVYQIDPNWFE